MQQPVYDAVNDCLSPDVMVIVKDHYQRLLDAFEDLVDEQVRGPLWRSKQLLVSVGQIVEGRFAEIRDEIPDPQSLGMWLKVNGHTRQASNTKNMIFDVPFLVSYLSRFMSLLPGDVISTGTPAGVGMGSKPQVFLKPGDVCTLGIDGLGEQRQLAVAR